MFIELTELIRQNIGVWSEVKVLFSKLFLHSDSVETKPIFTGDLMTLWEMVDFLVLIQAFVKIALTA